MKNVPVCLLRVVSGSLAIFSLAIAHPHNDGDPAHNHVSGQVHENGIGPDPDNDTNPATITGGFSISGEAALAKNDPPYDVITFEAGERDQGEIISTQYADKYGVTFGNGLSRQICEGQRRFKYDSKCTYEAAPSGRFAAGYEDSLNRPLKIEFKEPVCVVTMAIYPTGGKEDEPFQLTIKARDENGAALPTVNVDFSWTKDTVRWRHMAGAYYLATAAKSITIGMRSKDPREARDILRFLMDDLAFTTTDCEAALAKFQDKEEKAGDGLDLTIESDGKNKAVGVSAE